jgi:hypothetical protein
MMGRECVSAKLHLPTGLLYSWMLMEGHISFLFSTYVWWFFKLKKHTKILLHALMLHHKVLFEAQ